MLVENCTNDDLDSIFDNIFIVDFNYDRCLEHFLFEFIQCYFSLDHRRSAEVMSKLKIVHPYGKIGSLPYLDHGKGIEFGRIVDEDIVIKSSQSIRTYSEQISNENELKYIRSEISSSHRLVFLGFAFHTQNMRLLDPKDCANIKIKKIFFSTYGMSQSSIDVIISDVFPKFSPMCESVETFAKINLRCCEALDEYRKGITNVI